MKTFSGDYEERWKKFFAWQETAPEKDILGYVIGGNTLSVMYQELTNTAPEPDE